MKKKVFVICLTLLAMMFTACKKTKKIEPGKGAGKIVLGASFGDIAKQVGDRYKQVSFAREKSVWDRYYGYNVKEKILLFFLGFDYFLEYGRKSNKSDYPVWKLYFSKEKLVYMIFSAYRYPKWDLSATGVVPKAFFNGSLKEMEASLGKKYFSHLDSKKNQYYYYFDKGVAFFVKDKKIKAIHIFPAMSKEKSVEFIKNLSKKVPEKIKPLIKIK